MTRRQDTHSMKVEQRVREEQEKEQRRHSLPKRQKNKEQNVSSSYNSQERKSVLGRIERQHFPSIRTHNNKGIRETNKVCFPLNGSRYKERQLKWGDHL